MIVDKNLFYGKPKMTIDENIATAILIWAKTITSRPVEVVFEVEPHSAIAYVFYAKPNGLTELTPIAETRIV